VIPCACDLIISFCG